MFNQKETRNANSDSVNREFWKAANGHQKMASVNTSNLPKKKKDW